MKTSRSVPAAFLFGSILTLTCAPGLSQTSRPSLSIGGHKIMLGMPADVALAALRQDFKVILQSDDSPQLRTWLVFRKKPGLLLGTVYTNGKTVIGVDHLVFERGLMSAQDVFDAIFETSSKRVQTACKISQWTNYSLGMSIAVVRFACGEFQIRLLRSQFTSARNGESSADYQVWEDLGTTR